MSSYCLLPPIPTQWLGGRDACERGPYTTRLCQARLHWDTSYLEGLGEDCEIGVKGKPVKTGRK